MKDFCTPLIEALSSRCTIVANSARRDAEEHSEVRGWVDDGSDLVLMAEALNELASSRSTREALYDAADRHLQELRREKSRRSSDPRCLPCSTLREEEATDGGVGSRPSPRDTDTVQGRVAEAGRPATVSIVAAPPWMRWGDLHHTLDGLG